MEQYKERYMELREGNLKLITPDEQWEANIRSKSLRYYKPSSYEGFYATIGETYLEIENDALTAKQYFNKAAMSCHLSYQLASQEIPNTIPFIPKPGIWGSHNGYKYFILADNFKMLPVLAQTILDYKGEQCEPRLSHNLADACRNFWAGRLEKALPIVHKCYASSIKKSNVCYGGLASLLLGIIEKRPELIEQAMIMEEKAHIRESRAWPSIFSDIGLGMVFIAKLARHYGFDPDVSSKYIHKGLLEYNANIIYEEASELKYAMEMVLRNGGNGVKK